ncbi:hypothetical protein VFPBJ_05509 [Purpureocillium lilacinum]|uniref:Uncharacterized protein n=1 Tax=Purpureocillium lilacinum TaxID=33203 RepID=A0A179GPW9_PURLI|nr:hypothetical protein VFPBJ_05509 [Purpureocillium lilacinum]
MMCRQEQGDPWIEVATGTLDRLFRFWDKKPSRRGILFVIVRGCKSSSVKFLPWPCEPVTRI